MKGREDDHVKVFHGLKTFEYDLALEPDNRAAMLVALKELRPGSPSPWPPPSPGRWVMRNRPRRLFCGMFERKQNNVQKGSFAQSLAQVISDETIPFMVPAYIQAAIKHVCKVAAAPAP